MSFIAFSFLPSMAGASSSSWLPRGSAPGAVGWGEDVRCVFGVELDGTWWHSWPRSQQSLWHLLSAKLAGGTSNVVPTEKNSQFVFL